MTKQGYKLPRLGMRNIKTALCVFICLLINFALTKDVGLNSAIAAIVCMQSTIETTLKTGLNRLIGTAIGGALGMLLLYFAHNSIHDYLYILLMPIGIIVSIYLCNAIGLPGGSVICAIVFISVLISPMTPVSNIDNPYELAVFRIIDTAIGIVVATLVNRFIAPPSMYEPRNVHLVCDTFEEVYARVKQRLSGTEQLILYDTSLTQPGRRQPRREGTDTSNKNSVRIAIPTEYIENDYIYTVHISADYTVTPMYLKQSCGYVELPYETFPCTVVWQSQKEATSLSLRA